MMRSLLFSSLLLSAASSSFLPGHVQLAKRDSSQQVCTDLSVSSNNGDRKVAVVIDSSGSMSYSDYYDYRIVAGRALNEFLIGSSEASGSQKADQVTVIDFDDIATLDYPLGDPAGANASFSQIDADGGTYIASGVQMAIEQLTASNTGATDKRSAIVVFTDGEDSDTEELVDQIKKATDLGIRVSFGFLDTSAAYQDEEILQAIRDSRGVYATITVAAGSQNFINYVLLNGLTYNDNPQGYGSQLLAGLSETHFISGSETITLKYSATQGEEVTFDITTITAGSLSAVAQMNGKTLDSSSYSSSIISVTAPGTGELDLLVTADNAPQDSIFSVSTDSDVPIKNCTVGVGNSNQGLSAGAKAGIGVGVTAAVLGLLGTSGYFLWKHFHPPGGNTTAPVMTNGAEHTTMAEKVMPHTDVTPMGPSHTAAPPGGPPGGPTGPPGGPSGGQMPMNMPPNGSMGMPPNAMGLEGAPAGMDQVANLMHAPPPGTVSPGPMGVAPAVFIPPMIPPMAPGSPNSQHDSRSPHSSMASPNVPSSPNSQAPLNQQFAPGYSPSPQQVMGPYMPPQHTGSSFGVPPTGPYPPPTHPTAPFNPNHTSTPYAPSPYQQQLPGSGPPMGQNTGYPPPMSPPPAGGQQPMNTFSPQHTGSTFTPGPAPEMPTGQSSPTPGCPSPPGAVPPAPHQPFVPGGGQPPFATGTRTDKREEHHHHPWMPREVACVDPNCPFNLPEHACADERCECTCRDGECPLNR